MMCLAGDLSFTQKTGYFCEKTGYFWSFFFCLQILWFYTSVIVAWGLINPLFYEVHPILLTNPSPSFFFQNPSLQCCYCCLVSLAECVKLWLYQKLQHSVWLQHYDSGQTKKLFWANLGILWFYIGVTKIITCFKTNRQVTLGQFLPFYSPGGSKR